MTIEEAREIISDRVQLGQKEYMSDIPEYVEALKVAVEALDYQLANTVDHPVHYNIEGRKECIEEMVDKFGLKAVIIFCEINAYKYRYRHELKGGQKDLDKATWYDNKQRELAKELWNSL